MNFCGGSVGRRDFACAQRRSNRRKPHELQAFGEGRTTGLEPATPGTTIQIITLGGLDDPPRKRPVDTRFVVAPHGKTRIPENGDTRFRCTQVQIGAGWCCGVSVGATLLLTPHWFFPGQARQDPARRETLRLAAELISSERKKHVAKVDNTHGSVAETPRRKSRVKRGTPRSANCEGLQIMPTGTNRQPSQRVATRHGRNT